MSPAIARLGIIAMLLAVWEAGARLFSNPLFVSPPSRVVAALIDLLQDREVVAAVARTCLEIFAAFALSVIIGLTLGLIVEHEQRQDGRLRHCIQVQCIP